MNKIRVIQIEQAAPENVMSFSSIKDWKSCRMAWYYKRVRRISPRLKPVALKKGSVIHELLEAYLKGEDWRGKLPKIQEEYDNMSEEEKEHYGNIPGDCESIIQRYITYWKDDPVETLAVELGFGMDGKPPLELAPGVWMQGKIDWVFRNHHGIWVGDHKSFGRQLPNDAFRFQDLQTVIYFRALPLLGFPKPVGMVFNYLKSKVPPKPQVLKNGELSKSKKIGASYEGFMEAILENGLNPDDYLEQLEIAKGNLFYIRKYLAKPKTMADSMMDELRIVNLEMKYLRNFPIRNLRRECSFCSYCSLCTAEMLKLDVDYVLQNEYELRPEREVEKPGDQDEDEDENEG